MKTGFLSAGVKSHDAVHRAGNVPVGFGMWASRSIMAGGSCDIDAEDEEDAVDEDVERE